MINNKYIRRYIEKRKTNDPDFKKKESIRVTKINKEKKKRLFKQILDHYGHKCSCPKCPETNELFFTLDHVNNDGKKHRERIKNNRLRMYQDVIDQGFPNDYQILCWNCNFAKNCYGKCPHLG